MIVPRLTPKEEIEKEISSITKQLVEKYQAKKVVLFGSAAEGTFRHDSDLEFLVIKQDVPFNNSERLRELGQVVQKNRTVNFLVYREEELEKRLCAGDPYIKSIMGHGKVLHD